MGKIFSTTGWLVAIGLVGLIVVRLLSWQSPVISIAYSDFRQLADARLVDDLEIGPSSIDGALRMPAAAARLPASAALALERDGATGRFTTHRVADDRLIDRLAAAGIRYRGTADSGWLGTVAIWALPAASLLLWGMLLRRPGGLRDLNGMGRSQARVYLQQETGIGFDDIAGIDEAKAELQQIVAFLRDPQRYQRLGGKIPRAC